MIALLALGLLVQDAEIAALVAELGADAIEVREAAFRRLEKIGRPAVPQLEKAAGDSDGERASRARSLLVRIPILERLTPALIEGVQGIHERLARGEWRAVFLELAADLRQAPGLRRYPAVQARDLSFLAPLAVQRAETEQEKRAVCEAVGRCRLASALPEVAKLLQDPEPLVRANAAGAIRDAGSAEEGRALLPCAEDPSPVVRSVVAHALGRLNVTAGVPALRSLLRDPDANVRWWALRALADLDAKEATAAVEQRLEDPDDSVRRAAAEALKTLRRKP